MPITRRNFITTASAGLALGAAGTIGYQFRATAAAPVAQSGAPGDVLVTYASMMGSTGAQAETIAQSLRAAGRKVHVAPVNDALDPSNYTAIIMGSAIRTSAWLPEMTGWAETHADALGNMPVALFQCSMTCAGFWADGTAPDAQQRAHLRKDMASLITAAPALEFKPFAFFPGAVNYDHLSPAIRLGYPIASGGFLIGDHRKPDLVAGWGQDLVSHGTLA